MDRGALRNCPECRQAWPQGAEHDLRSFRWLHDLPRNVSVSNADAIIHDGAHGNRFLVLETKRPDEPRQMGQEWLLASLAGLPRWTVRILRGDATTLAVHRVTSAGVNPETYRTTPDLFRTAVVRWLDGQIWVDPEIAYTAPMATSTSVDVDDLLRELRW